MHSRLALLLSIPSANHVPLKTKSSHCFSFSLWRISFFTSDVYIVYDTTCTEDLKLFYLHRGNTFKMHLSLFFF